MLALKYQIVVKDIFNKLDNFHLIVNKMATFYVRNPMSF